jgi:UDP-2,4-diacetamido-2,4,6-trideoxy-beta-L-altropyranose hydrolase
MRIAIRADGSSTIGIGHIKRCLALARSLRDMGAQLRFVTRDEGNFSRTLIRREGFDVSVLPSPPTGPAWDADSTETIIALASFAPDWIVVDHYELGAPWHAALRRATGARLAAIDDLADRTLEVDLLINHNPVEDHHIKYHGCLPSEARLLGGARFALIDALYALAPRYTFHEEVRSIGIFMGGADAAQASALALKACREHAGFRGSIEVVTTSANAHLDQLRASCTRWQATQLSVDLPDLAAFFGRHDLQLGAGGGATWERCCIGAPTLALVGAANQRSVVGALVALGVAVTAQELDPAAIGRAVADMIADVNRRRSLHARSLQLVDGRGAQRVAVALWDRSISLRLAKSGDWSLVYQWRNDPSTRAHFHDPAPLDIASHRAWWERSLSEPGRWLLLVYCGSRAVGVLRFDRRTPHEADVSMYLDPQLVGLGLGVAVLDAGKRWLTTFEAGIRVLVASIRHDNRRSQAAFRAAGFRQRGGMEWEFRIEG